MILEVNYPEHLKKINIHVFFISWNRRIKFAENNLTKIFHGSELLNEFTKLYALRAHVPYIPKCLRVLNYYVPACPHFSRAYVPKCLSAYI